MATRKKKSTKKTTTKPKTTTKTSSKSKKTVKALKEDIKETVAKKTTTKKTAKKATTKSKTSITSKTEETAKTKSISKEIELPKTKEQARIEEATKELELKKALEDKIKTIEDLEATNTLKTLKSKASKPKRKSNAKTIAKTKASNFQKKLKKLQRKIKIYGIDSVLSKKTILSSLAILLVVIALIVGLNNHNHDKDSINLDNISSEIDQLKTLRFDINNTSKIIESSDSYKATLKEYYEYDFDDFNLKRSWLDEFRIYYNEKVKQAFMVFNPSTDNTNNVTTAIEKFFKTKKITYTKEEYDGYLFYVSSNDDKKVISKIKQSQIKVFDILQELNKEEIKSKYGIDSNLYKEYKVKTAMIVKSDVTEYLLFLPKNNSSAKEIEKLMDEYYKKKEETWQDDEENLSLLHNRYTGYYNGYLVYVVSKDNDLVLQLIKK